MIIPVCISSILCIIEIYVRSINPCIGFVLQKTSVPSFFEGNCRRLSSACFGRGHGGEGGVNHEPNGELFWGVPASTPNTLDSSWTWLPFWHTKMESFLSNQWILSRLFSLASNLIIWLEYYIYILYIIYSICIIYIYFCHIDSAISWSRFGQTTGLFKRHVPKWGTHPWNHSQFLLASLGQPLNHQGSPLIWTIMKMT